MTSPLGGWTELLGYIEAESALETHDPETVWLDRLPYADPPEGFGDPVDEAARLEIIDRVRSALNAMPRQYRLIVSRVFGLDGITQTPEVYATEQGISRRTAYLLLAEAKRRLAKRLKNL